MKKIFKIIFVILLLLSILPVGDVIHAGFGYVKMSQMDETKQEVYAGQILNTNDCKGNSEDIICEAKLVLGRDVSFTTKKTDEYSCRIDSYGLAVLGFFYVTPDTCSKIDELYNKTDNYKSNYNLSGVGVSGCANDFDTSMDCYVAKELGPGIKYSVGINDAEYELGFLVNVNGMTVNIWTDAIPKNEYLSGTQLYLYSDKIKDTKIKINNNSNDIVLNLQTSKLNLDNRYFNHGEYYAYSSGYISYEDVLEIYPEVIEGIVISKDETYDYLIQTLSGLGLGYGETARFMLYWLPRLQEHEYNLISFLGEWLNEQIPLEIEPTANKINRIFMVFQGLDEPIDIPLQEIPLLKNAEFDVIEVSAIEIQK